MRWTLFFDRSRTNKNIKITLKKKKRICNNFLNDHRNVSNKTSPNTSDQETIHRRILRDRITPPPPSKQPLNFIPIFFDSIFVVCSVRNGNVLFARGDSTVPWPRELWKLQTARTSKFPKECSVSTGFAGRVISSEPSLNVAACHSHCRTPCFNLLRAHLLLLLFNNYQWLE